jgi:peptide/nickel transport system ATP-binding protein
MPPVLSVRDLVVEYASPDGPIRAVDRVSFDVGEGEILGLAGESGSGKSTIAQAVLRVLGPGAVIAGGEVRVDGQDVLDIAAGDRAALRAWRWRTVSLVPQSAMNALNPVLPVGEHLVETLLAHEPISRRAAEARAGELLELTGIPAARASAYPHELSGGQRQRVGIALALALSPRLVFFDEPTTALDVVVQREVLQRLLLLRDRLKFAMVFITHDLSLLLDLADRVGVLYAGRLVELARSGTLREAPSHPYTRGLLAAMPSVTGPRVKLGGIPGAPPDPRRRGAGCAFAPRCPMATPRCETVEPVLRMTRSAAVACHGVSP